MNDELIAKVKEIRQLIEKAMTSSTALTDEEALTATCMFPKWSGESVSYTAGQRVQDDGVLYTVLTAHTSQSTWKPKDSPSLFAKVLIPDPETVPDWEQPDSTNAYKKGDKVKHNGKTWESLVDGNIWEPGVTGTESLWAEVIE